MPKQSPLKHLYRAAAAECTEENGWILPLHFGDPLQEYQSVRTQVGLLDLCHRGLLRLTGPDRISFLQGMVSNDVKSLNPRDGIYAAFLDIHGKILADVRIFSMDDSLLLDLWEPLKDKILAHLNRYLIADEVEIADLTGQYSTLSPQGPKARPLLEELFQHQQFPARELEHRPFRVGDTDLFIVRATHTGEEGYDLLLPIKDLLPTGSRIQEIGKKFSLQWVGTQAQEILRIEAGIPRYGMDMNEDNLLLETGLDQAVNFHKGCYLGQEVVERVRSRGHVNRKLVGMLLEGETAADRGSPIYAGEKEIGKVTSSVSSPASKRPLAFGYVHRDYVQPATAVTIRSNARVIPALVSALPFYRSPALLESP